MLFCSVISKTGQVDLSNSIVEEVIDDRRKSVAAAIIEDIGGMYALLGYII